MSKNKIVFWVMVIIFFATVTVFAEKLPYGKELPSGENPLDCFPLENGNEWHYQITLFGNALEYTDTLIYPENELYSIREIYKNQGTNKHYLEFKITGTNDKSPDYGEVKNVEVTKDTLGVFKSNAGVAFSKNDNSISLLRQTRFDDPKQHMQSSRPLFFVGNIGDSINRKFGDYQSPSQLLYLGVDVSTTGYEGQNCMHFVRLVEPDPPDRHGGHCQVGAEKEFTEDMWFLKGKGLVRLEQKVDGEISMLWILENFSPNK